MRFGFRRPSFGRRLAARTSWKRYVRHSLGINAPRAWGWLTNPKRAAYNRIYGRITIDSIKLLTGRRRWASSGCMVWVAVLIGGSAGLTWWLA
jgi:hypothetical protein